MPTNITAKFDEDQIITIQHTNSQYPNSMGIHTVNFETSIFFIKLIDCLHGQVVRVNDL